VVRSTALFAKLPELKAEVRALAKRLAALEAGDHTES
jgi:hypothetical protein